MKRLGIPLALAIAAAGLLLLAVSCSGGGSGAGRGSNATYNPVDGLSTYKENGKRNGKPLFEKSDIYLSLNEKITVTGRTASGFYPSFGDPNTLSEGDFTLIKNSDGKELWAATKFLVPNGRLAAVTSSAAIAYQKADLATPTDNIVSRMTVVGVFPEPATNGFLKVTGWDETLHRPYTEVYLKTGDLSFENDDVQSAMLYLRAAKSENPIVKEQLLNNAAGFVGSAFGEEIRRALANVAGSTAKAAAADQAATATGDERATEGFDFSGIINDSDVNVRSKPIETSASVGTLQKGTKVTVIAHTVDSYPIGGQNAQWLKISAPQTGWIFGAFVDPAP